MDTSQSPSSQYANQEVSYVRDRRLGEAQRVPGTGNLHIAVPRVGFTATDDLWK